MFAIFPFCVLLGMLHQADASMITIPPRATIPTPTIKGQNEGGIFAVNPTTKGQIGINPVESDLGDPDTYIGSIYGTDTQYITLQETSTKWIGVNTEYLSMDGTSTVEVVIATATAAANGQHIGDISIILPEGLADALETSVLTAINSCGAIVKKARRDVALHRRQADAVLSCAFQYAKIAAEDGGTFDAYISVQQWLGTSLKLASNAPAVLSNYIALLGAAEAKKTIIWLAAFSITINALENQAISGHSSALSAIGKINIPSTGFATKPEDKKCTGAEPVNEDSLLCREYICQGEDTGFCTIPPNEKCPCILTIPPSPGAQAWNQTWLDYQQQWLLDVFSGSSSVQNKNIRLLPLGDSITNGYQSTDGNGYRLQLYNDLISGHNNTVDFIGSVRAGTMADNYNEGHNGATIDQIASFAGESLSQRPNVVLIHAGTNDMNLPLDPSGAPDRLGNLIDTVLATCPDALVLVAQIIPSGGATTEANIIQFNAAIPGVVNARAHKGYHVLTVDMFTRLTSPKDYADGLHPNDIGYTIMGNVWYEALGYADAVLNWITPPIGSATKPGLVYCPNLPVWYPQGEIANGAGLGPGEYPGIICVDGTDATHCKCQIIDASTPAFTMELTGDSCSDMGYYLIRSVHFADLNGDGRAEYLWVDDGGAVTAFLNLGSPSGQESTKGASVQWLPQGVIAAGIGAPRQEIQFADLNGDGRAEYLRVHPNGSVEAWLNLGGPNDGPNAAQVGWLYNGFVATGIGAPGSSVVFADINGDGRAEYLSIDSHGAVTCYLNLGPIIDNGPHAAVVGWLPQGVIATGAPGFQMYRQGIVLADINGDGRADYLDLTIVESGAVSAWLNGGGPNDGPNAAQVVWYPKGSITTGDGTHGEFVVFADLNGDGRAEYIEVNPETSAVTVYMNGCP